MARLVQSYYNRGEVSDDGGLVKHATPQVNHAAEEKRTELRRCRFKRQRNRYIRECSLAATLGLMS
ncbi:hypothetical protein M378DRAFT_174446 [Amanita muscaria Koide BX008]|uniref:Uncharacterized protein n=1 Tax=Amanita muscaria (strain Koide BX008) TaxID=946122 RepID=A0A0C2VZ38_AMAMK|nr:hypothetical protein M378DRAFT_174446 [Amanita muscaria Koide BX008]